MAPYDSICLHCFDTVSTTHSESLLDSPESQHRCSQADLWQYRRMRAIDRTRGNKNLCNFARFQWPCVRWAHNAISPKRVVLEVTSMRSWVIDTALLETPSRLAAQRCTFKARFSGILPSSRWQSVNLRFRDKGSHRLSQLRVNFVRYSHNTHQQQAEVDAMDVILQSLED
jgi:hypothetical protein